MALPITIPYTFANATSSIPLSNLDTDFTTVANAINGIGNGTVGLTTITSPAATALTIQSAGTTAMTVDTSQNVGIGTTSPGRKLDIEQASTDYQMRIGDAGGNYYDIGRNSGNGLLTFYGNQAAASGYVFSTVNGERARIDTSGNLLVGTTNSYAKTYIIGPANSTYSSGVLLVDSNDATDLNYPAAMFRKKSNDQTSSQVYVRFTCNAGAVGNGQINGNGASQAAFGTYSDQRLKENITSLPSQLANVCALRPVEFDYIESEGGGHQIGFIAQEMQAIYPDSVGERPDGMLTVTGWSKTEARLVAAIQELSAKNDALEARLAALEAK